jgi:hypothetical protein
MSKQGFIIDANGIIKGNVLVNTDAEVELNTPAGCSFVESSIPELHAVVAVGSNGFIVTEGPARNPDDPVIFVQNHGFDALKAKVAFQIDAAAEATRLKYITGGSGQAMVYQQKSNEAKAYTAAVSPVDTDYPLLSAEATATGVTVAALASSVLAVTGQWVALAAEIEGLRMGAKKAVSDAVTIEAVLAAEQINWP